MASVHANGVINLVLWAIISFLSYFVFHLLLSFFSFGFVSVLEFDLFQSFMGIFFFTF